MVAGIRMGLGLAALACLAGCGSASSGSAPELEGAWLSSCAADSVGRSSQVRVYFHDGQYTRLGLAYDDAQCGMISSVYKLSGEARTSDGSSVRIVFRSATALPATAPTAAQFNSIGMCGYHQWTTSNPRTVTGMRCENGTYPPADSEETRAFSIEGGTILHLGASAEGGTGEEAFAREGRGSQ